MGVGHPLGCKNIVSPSNQVVVMISNQTGNLFSFDSDTDLWMANVQHY